MKQVKLPEECRTIEDVRAEIDNLDQQIISLLGKRFLYVKEIVRFKSNSEEIKAVERFDAVIRSRRELAIRNNLSPDIIEKMYRLLIGYFIEEEHNILNQQQKKL